MKYLAIIVLLLIPVGSFAQSAIPIQNPSFEIPVSFNHIDQCGQGNWGTIPDWIAQQPAGSSFGVIDWTCEPIPDGKAVAFLAYGASMSQDLKVTPKSGDYLLKFWIASWFYSYPATYVVSLTIGGIPVCTTSGYSTGDFKEIQLPCSIDKYISNGGFSYLTGNLGISVGQKLCNGHLAWPLLFDNVSLTFTPTN